MKGNNIISWIGALTGTISLVWQIWRSRPRLAIMADWVPVGGQRITFELMIYVTNMSSRPITLIKYGFVAPKPYTYGDIRLESPRTVAPGECVMIRFPVRDYHYMWMLPRTQSAVLPKSEDMPEDLKRFLLYAIGVVDSIGHRHYAKNGPWASWQRHQMWRHSKVSGAASSE